MSSGSEKVFYGADHYGSRPFQVVSDRLWLDFCEGAVNDINNSFKMNGCRADTNYISGVLSIS